MADEPKPEEQSFLKRLLARKPKPEKPFVLNPLQDLPYVDKPLPDNRNAKVVAGSASAFIESVGPVSAAGSMGVFGGLFHFITGWLANTSIQNMTNPTPYDLLVRRLDKRALQILQARLKVLRSHKDLIERVQKIGWEGSDKFALGGNTTVNEIRDHAVDMYAEAMEGDGSFPRVVESLERFIQEGGRKKSDKEVSKALEGRIIVACRRYHWADDLVIDLKLWENKYRDQERRAKKEADKERQSHGVLE